MLTASWAFCFKIFQYVLTKLHPEEYSQKEASEAVQPLLSGALMMTVGTRC